MRKQVRKQLVLLRKMVLQNNVALSSYPRSGNTWLSKLVEELSGRRTGSIHPDNAVFQRPVGGIIIKTHKRDAFRYNRFIHLVRNPFDAIASYYGFVHVFYSDKAEDWETHVRKQCAKWKDDETLWTHVLQYHESSWMAWHAVGTLQLRRGNYPHAEMAFRASMVNTERVMEPRLGLAKALQLQGRMAEALVEAEVIVERDGTKLLPGAWKIIGGVHFAERRFPEAVEAFRRVLELTPEDFKTRHNLASCLAVSGSPEEALTVLGPEVADEPKESLTVRGLAHELSGREAEALAFYRRSLALDPSQVALQRRAERLESRVGADGSR